jgi:hypothetical protein
MMARAKQNLQSGTASRMLQSIKTASTLPVHNQIKSANKNHQFRKSIDINHLLLGNTKSVILIAEGYDQTVLPKSFERNI